MSSYMRTLLLLTIILTCNAARSQTATTNTISDDLPGTWIGYFMQIDKTGAGKGQAQLLWRIHCVDSVKKQVELTEMGQRFDNGAEIQNHHTSPTS